MNPLTSPIGEATALAIDRDQHFGAGPADTPLGLIAALVEGSLAAQLEEMGDFEAGIVDRLALELDLDIDVLIRAHDNLTDRLRPVVSAITEQWLADWSTK